jgi:hypothetical protein
VRASFFILLAMNILYLAWAGWIDAPAPLPARPQSTPALPTLMLVTEQRSPDQTRPSQPATRGASGLQEAVDSPGGASSRSATTRCVSIGPFNDLARAARGAALLRERGYSPRQRAEEGEAWEGFWVYIGSLQSAADEARVLNSLERAGIRDAHAMPENREGRRVSVGLFSDKQRAEKRAEAVRKLGHPADIVDRKQSGTVYWADIDLAATDRAVSTEGLLTVDDAGSRLEIRACPGSTPAPAQPGPTPRDARPTVTTAAAGPQPG